MAVGRDGGSLGGVGDQKRMGWNGIAVRGEPFLVVVMETWQQIVDTESSLYCEGLATVGGDDGGLRGMGDRKRRSWNSLGLGGEPFRRSSWKLMALTVLVAAEGNP